MKNYIKKLSFVETSLVDQWLTLHTPNGASLSLIPGQGTRSHVLQLKLGIAK